MKEKQKLKNAKGITLVALVVTIIVLVILAGVSITAVLSQNGVIGESKEAKEKTLNAEVHEQEQMNEIVEYIQNNGANGAKDLISKEKSYVGYYADIDGDETVDGVIYADLAVSKSGEWYNSDGAYSYEAIGGIKDYYVSQKNYEGPFGTKDVLVAIEGEETEADRFYVMALEDFNKGTDYCWYDDAYGNMTDYSTYTSADFGKGKENTEKMIEKWNNDGYGSKNDGVWSDVWGAIQDKANEGWFVPSKAEWAAFGGNLEITSTNYTDYDLSVWYWCSTQYTKSFAYDILFSAGKMNYRNVTNNTCLRLGTTF